MTNERVWGYSPFKNTEEDRKKILRKRRELKKTLIQQGFEVKTGQNDMPMANRIYWLEWKQK